MTVSPRLTSIALIGLAAAACTPAERTETAETDAATAAAPAAAPETRTVVETREVPVPVVVDTTDVPPPVVVEDRRGDTTTVRAGRDGIEVETTDRQ